MPEQVINSNIPVNPARKNKLIDKLPVSPRVAAVLAVAFLCMFCFLATYVTQLDTMLFPLSLEVEVKNQSGEPIDNARILIDGEFIDETDENGALLVEDVSRGQIELRVERQGYIPKEENVNISRNGLSYKNTVVITLSEGGDASLRGRVVFEGDELDYNFVDDRIFIDDKSFTVGTDGSFELSDISSGEISFSFRSAYFMDINETIEIEPGTNELEDITLTPAGDITQELLSYVREDEVSEITVEGESIFPDQITTEDGTLKIIDLEVGKNYTIRVVAPGYENRDYSISIVQGPNTIQDFRLVEASRAIFLAELEDTDGRRFYSAALDGTDLHNAIDEDFDETSFYFNPQDGLAYIMSEKDRISSTLGGRTPVMYAFDFERRETLKITGNTTDIGTLYPQYQAKRIIQISKPSRSSTTRIMELCNYELTECQELVRNDNTEFNDFVLSTDGNTLAYIAKNIQNETSSLVHMQVGSRTTKTISTRSGLDLHAVSDNGKRIIFSANVTSNNFTDLMMYDTETQETRSLITDERGSDYQFLLGSDNSLIYWDLRGGNTDIYEIDINQNAVSQITKLSALDKISRIYQQGDWTYYITNRGLYVIDINMPVTNKRVIEGEIFYPNT